LTYSLSVTQLISAKAPVQSSLRSNVITLKRGKLSVTRYSFELSIGLRQR